MNHGRCRRIVFFLAMAGLFALLMITPMPQSIRAAGPRYVTPSGVDSSNDCTNSNNPCATIQHAVDEADPSDTVYVATGTYNSTASEVVLLNKDIILSGGWDNTFTTQSDNSIVDGEGARQGIIVGSGVTATIVRFTIQDGYRYPSSGGGVRNSGILTLNDSIISGNRSPYDGGGIYNSGTLTMNNSTVSDNTAEFSAGGGIYNDVGSTMILNTSIISGNTVHGWGGGIHNSGILTLTNSTVRGNATPYQGHSGGGIWNWGTLTLNQSVISGNTAASWAGGVFNGGTLALNQSAVTDNTANGIGGGILADRTSTSVLNNSTISNNTVNSGAGGGIRNSGILTLTNVTISGNMADTGGGIWMNTGAGIFATLQNTIVASNMAESGPDCFGTLGSVGYNLIEDTAGCTFSATTGDLLSIDAGLFPLIGSPGYHPLLSGSPAIDAGNPAGCTDHLGNPLDADQRGVARVGRCDIGAYEFDPANDPLTYSYLPIVIRSDWAHLSVFPAPLPRLKGE